MSDSWQLSLGLDTAASRQPCNVVPGFLHLPGFALPGADALLTGIAAIERAAPLRHMKTPGGLSMSVATTNAGPLGWVSDTRGYRYSAVDPESGAPWPELPSGFLHLAARAAEAAGYAAFAPDACLINRYEVGAGMGMHQDRDEQDFNQPIVSVSLGLPAVFNFGGLTRKDKPVAVTLLHGDVVVFGGPARRCYHGIKPIKAGHHPALGACRYNLTFRRAR